ncbi:MAG TPA: hypothetical protein VFE79_12435 [Paraburkholderia sp.]|nr:hypothetical protein [Paraburkholderia sp.]
MKNTIAALMAVSVALVPFSSAWAQDNPASSPATASGNPDEIVRMHQQIAAADRQYNKEVAAAKKVYDQKKAVAKKKHAAAVEAARSGTGQ